MEGLEGCDYDGSSLNSPERNVGNFSEVPEKLPGFEGCLTSTNGALHYTNPFGRNVVLAVINHLFLIP